MSKHYIKKSGVGLIALAWLMGTNQRRENKMNKRDRAIGAFPTEHDQAPTTTKRVGYINVYPKAYDDCIWPSEELANTYSKASRIACVKTEYIFEA